MVGEGAVVVLGGGLGGGLFGSLSGSLLGSFAGQALGFGLFTCSLFGGEAGFFGSLFLGGYAGSLGGGSGKFGFFLLVVIAEGKG